LLCGSGCQAAGPQTELQVSESIRRRLESSLFEFEPDIQRHYAVRMYRLTGDSRYFQPIMYDLVVTLDRLREDLRRANDSSYVLSRCVQMRSSLNPATRKDRLRLAVFEKAGTIDFYLNLATIANKLADYRLTHTESLGPLFDSTLNVLRAVDFSSFLLDTAVIRVFAPQVVNYVYYLADLGIVDLRERYVRVFRDVYSDSDDSRLSKDEFMDKAYGLTHFITAASRYYQQSVDSVEFAWILKYFETRQDRILADTKADIIAEVGVCFLLAGQERHAIVMECSRKVTEQFNSEAGIIPSPGGNTDLAHSEHRNMLAYMLLNWPERLFPGPDLASSKAFKDLLGVPTESDE